MVRVDFDNSAVERVLADARREQLSESGRALLGLCKVNAPEDSEYMRDHHELRGLDADATEILVVSTAPYSLYVHEGTRPHEIPNAFGRGFTVQHPGYAGDPWMTRSVDQMAAGNG